MAGCKKGLKRDTILQYYNIVVQRKRAISREGMVVTTVALDGELHQRLSIAAVEEKTVMTELVRQAVSEWLDRRERIQKGRAKR